MQCTQYTQCNAQTPRGDKGTVILRNSSFTHVDLAAVSRQLYPLGDEFERMYSASSSPSHRRAILRILSMSGYTNHLGIIVIIILSQLHGGKGRR